MATRPPPPAPRQWVLTKSTKYPRHMTKDGAGNIHLVGGCVLGTWLPGEIKMSKTDRDWIGFVVVLVMLCICMGVLALVS